MFITIDADRCMGHGRCYSVAPDLLTYDDEGFVAERGRCWELAPDQVADAEEAVRSCPESAISVSEVPTPVS